MAAFSIVMPAFRAEATIERAVASVLAQTVADWELLIVADDGADYRSVLHARGIRDERIRFCSTGAVGAGPSVARNVGIDAATHRLIGNLDADDTLSPDYMALLAAPVERWGAATSHWMRVAAEPTPPAPLPHDPLLRFPWLLRHELAFANIVFDARRVRPRWPHGIRYGEDLVFWVGLFDEVDAIAHVPTAHYRYHVTAGSLSDLTGGTERVYHERARAIAWLDGPQCTIRNARNRGLLRRWLAAQNELEPRFGFRRVSHAVHHAELARVLGNGWRSVMQAAS